MIGMDRDGGVAFFRAACTKSQAGGYAADMSRDLASMSPDNSPLLRCFVQSTSFMVQLPTRSFFLLVARYWDMNYDWDPSTKTHGDGAAERLGHILYFPSGAKISDKCCAPAATRSEFYHALCPMMSSQLCK